MVFDGFFTNYFQNMGSIKEVQERDENGVMKTYKAWVWTDYIQFGFGLLDGSMSALPQQSYTYYCNKNVTAARLQLATLILYYNAGSTT
jgi:hypothetical protein